MLDESLTNAVDKWSAPAGVASEITAAEPLTVEMAAAFGGWLRDKLGDSPEGPERLALHSGLPAADISQLLNRQGLDSLNRDHVQRLATALIEMHIITHADEAWTAAGLGGSDYLVPPMQVVQALSGNT